MSNSNFSTTMGLCDECGKSAEKCKCPWDDEDDEEEYKEEPYIMKF